MVCQKYNNCPNYPMLLLKNYGCQHEETRYNAYRAL